MVSESSPVCPRCHQLDQVRKVMSIVSEGMTTGHYDSFVPLNWQGKTYYFPAQRNVAFSTVLAQRLLPPPQPAKPKRVRESPEKFLPSSVKIFMYASAIGSMIIGCIAAVLLAQYLRLPSNNFITALVVLCTTAIVGILIIVTVIPILRLFPPTSGFITQAASVDAESRRTAKVVTEENYQTKVWLYEGWDRAIAHWNELYYCARDDGVFLRSSRLVPVSEMYNLTQVATLQTVDADS